MKIRLNEIPSEGREYIFDRASGELNLPLADLIGDHAYHVEMFIKPIGNAYELRGHVKTTLTEICSKCGWDFELPMERKLNEILFEEQEEHRKSHSVHGNQSVDFLGGGPSMTPVRGDVFDAGDYTHEVIALSEPFYPTCGEGESCLRSDEVSEIQRRLQLDFAAADETEKHSPFSVLKDLGLESKT